MILYVSVEPPHDWALTGRRGETVDQGTVDGLDLLGLPKRVTQFVGVVPGSRVSIHKVDLPARSRSKALASLPYALEERLAADVEDLEFGMLDWKSGENATVSVVDKEYIDAVYSRVASLPRRFDALVPDFLLLPLHPQARITLARLKDGTYAVREGEYSGVSLDPGALEYWWRSLGDASTPVAVNDLDTARALIDLGGVSISEWSIGDGFVDWLAHGHTPVERINISPSARSAAAPGSSRLFRAAAVALGIGVASKIGVDIYDNYRLYRENLAMDQEIVQIFQTAFPDVTRIVNPRLQLEQLMQELQTGSVAPGRFQLLLSSVAQVLPATQAKLEEISFRDDILLITCTTADFEGLDRLKQRFSEDRRVQVELISSGSRDNQVSARFRLQPA